MCCCMLESENWWADSCFADRHRAQEYTHAAAEAGEKEASHDVPACPLPLSVWACVCVCVPALLNSLNWEHNIKQTRTRAAAAPWCCSRAYIKQTLVDGHWKKKSWRQRERTQEDEDKLKKDGEIRQSVSFCSHKTFQMDTSSYQHRGSKVRRCFRLWSPLRQIYDLRQSGLDFKKTINNCLYDSGVDKNNFIWRNCGFLVCGCYWMFAPMCLCLYHACLLYSEYHTGFHLWVVLVYYEIMVGCRSVF